MRRYMLSNTFTWSVTNFGVAAVRGQKGNDLINIVLERRISFFTFFL